MAINLTLKSNRTLLGKRYTTDAYTDQQDAYTSVFDLNTSEIYTQTDLVPTSSLPFSGSSQAGYYYTTTGTVSANPTGNDVLKFWYRQILTKSDLANTGDEVWLFLSGSGSPAGGVGVQLISSSQMTDFISPKYITSNLSTNNTEVAGAPGYLVRALYSNNGSSFTEIDPGFYNFDYKTGILQFSSSAIANTVIADQTNGRVYLTAYQYVGEKLNTRLQTISSSLAAISSSTSVGSGVMLTSGSTSVSVYPESIVTIVNGVTASLYSNSGSTFITPIYGTGSGLVNVTASYLGSSAINNNTDNYLLTATGNGSINGEANLTFNGTTLTVNGNASITGDLTVAGTASFVNAQNLNIADQFISIASGSTSLTDSGIISQYNVAGSGSAFYIEATDTGTYGRWAVAYDIMGTSTSVTADEYMVTAKKSAGAPPVSPTWGGTTSGYGNIYINSSDDSIYIYV
jgi:hypothetical protein